ncbi:hypothetical protein GCM10009648_07330 [Tsukamurella spumae]
MDQSVRNSRIRFAVYVIAGIANLVSIYLVAVGALGAAEAALVNGVNVFICGLAGFNVPTPDDDI